MTRAISLTDHLKNGFTFWSSTRYMILALSTLCLSLVVANSLALNFTIICMNRGDSLSTTVHAIRSSASSENSTNNVRAPMFSIVQESWLFSAVAAGTLFGTVPITSITSSLGTRKMFVIYGLISALATFFTPFAIFYGGFLALLAMRFCQGIAMATSYVAMGAISAEWSPLKQSGMFLCVISCHLQLGPIFLMPVAGELCESQLGWPAVYYLLGIATFFSFILFFWLFRDSPRSQKNVSLKELVLIEEGKTHHGHITRNEHSPKVPYRKMMKDSFVLVILLVQIGSSLGLQIFVLYGPLYLSKALGMEVTKTGFAAALPHLLSVLLKLIAGPLSDWLTCISEKARIIFFASISQYLMAICFGAMVLLPSSELLLIQVCFTAVTMFSGLNTVGVTKCIQLTSRHFSHVIFSWRTFVNSLIILLLPILVSEMVPDGSIKQWNQIFLMIGVVLAVTTTLFDFAAEVEPRSWARSDGSSTSIYSSSSS